MSQKLHPMIVQQYFTISRAKISESGNRYFSEPTGAVFGRGTNTSNPGSGGAGLKPRPSRCFLRNSLNFSGVMLLEGKPAMD